MADRLSKKKMSSFHLQDVARFQSPVARHGAPADVSDDENIDVVVLEAVLVQSAASDFDVQSAFTALQLGAFDPANADDVARKLFPGLDGAALNVAADGLWRHVQAHAHESSLLQFRQALAPFLSPPRAPRENVDGGTQSAPGARVPEQPPSPETALQRCIHQLDSGKYTDTHEMVSQAFAGITGRPLLEQLLALELHVKGSSLDEIERDAVLNVINRLRQADPSGARRKFQLQGIKSLGPVQDLGNRVVQQMHRAGESAQAINAFLDGLSASALMETLGRLLDPSTKVEPVLVQLAKDRMRLINLQERALALAPLIDWHEGGCTADPPPLPIPDDAPASVALLRQLVLVAEQEQDVAPAVTGRLHEALQAYREAVDVVTARGLADARWIKRVRAAMREQELPGEVLKALLKLCGSKAAVAVALVAAMEYPVAEGTDILNDEAWTPEEWRRLRRIVAESYAIEGKSRQDLARPGEDGPTTLKITPEKMPKRKAGAEAREHYHAKQKAVAERQRMAFNDAMVVCRLLSDLVDDGTCDEELCVQLLVDSPMSRERLLLALAIVACDLRVRQQPLARRLMDKMDQAVPSIMQIKPLTIRERIEGAGRVFGNGLREGLLAHWVAAGIMRSAVHASGPWGTIVLTIVSTCVVPFIGSRYLHSLESPDYRMHPRKTVRFLLDIMPGLGALGGIGFSLYVGIQYGVFSEEGIHTVLIGLAANNLARFLIRQPIQSWTQSRLTRGFVLVDRQGNPPSERFQYVFNILRDVAYTLPYIAASVCTPEFVRGLADDVFPVLDDFLSVLGHSFIMTFPGAAVEFWDGMLIDIGLALAAAVMADYILQQGNQRNPGRQWAHWMRNGLARSVSMALSDLLNSLSAFLSRSGYRTAALVLAALAGAAGGACGAVRSRIFNYVMTLVSTRENGSVLPDGLITFMGRGAVFLGSGVAHACGAFSSLLGWGNNVSGSGSGSDNASDNASDSFSDDEAYFDPENDEASPSVQ